MQDQNYSQRAMDELRKQYENLIGVYDRISLEKLNQHLPEPMRYKSKGEFAYLRTMQIWAINEFALAVGLLSVDEVRSLLRSYEAQRPDIFRITPDDL